MSILDQLEPQKYISVETYKKNNDAVRTPVWFVIKDKLVYVVTRDQTGKVKRLKNNQKVIAWTINDESEMRLLIERGVDGIMTDKILLLKKILIEQNKWK